MIFVWIAGGLAARRLGAGDRAFAALNKFIVWVPLSALVLISLHRLQWESTYWAPVSMAWLAFAGAVAFFVLLGKRFGWPAKTVGALVMTGGLGNTAFVGYPLIRAIYGERAMPLAVLIDQAGSFFVLATAGLAAASYFSAGRASAGAVIRRMARFPPLWALIAAVVLRPFAFPADLETLLHGAARLLVPLALISVGGALSFDRALMRRERRPLVAGLAYKLALFPLALAFVLVAALGQRGEAIRVTVVQSAMAPMITGAIVAEEHGLDGELCSLMVSLGIPLSLLTVPLWAKLLSALGV
jgi:predicted permease